MSSPDQLTIETPEQTALEFPVAGIGSRFLAVALDTLIQASAATLCLILVGFLLPRFLPRHRGGVWLAAMLIMIAFLLEFVYYALFEALWNGQTPGKRLTNLRVIKDSGRPISAFEAILRNLLRIVDSLPGIYAVGIVCAVFSRQSKRLGDWVAGTVVVHEKPLEGYRPVWETAAKAGAVPYDARKLSVEELRLVESFLDRRSSLESVVRRDMAQQIANRLGQQLNIPAESRPDAEKFLETLAELRRSAARY
jgi:uncharacterized RDD family membrane protein YckC